MDEEHSKEYVKVCIKDIKTNVCRILGNRGLLRSETRSVEAAIDLTIPKIMALFFERMEDIRMGKYSNQKGMTLNNEKILLFKEDDIIKLKKIFRG